MDERDTAAKESPTRTQEREEVDPNPELLSVEERGHIAGSIEQQARGTLPFSRKLKKTQSNPLSSLLYKSYKFLSKAQIEVQTRRFQSYKQKRTGQIQKKADELEQLRQFVTLFRQAHMKKIPTLTENTLQICRAVPNDPIYNRYEKQLEKSRQERQAKVEQAEKARQELQQKQLAEMEQYHQRSKLSKSRTVDEYFEESERWKRKREEALQAKREQRSQLEVKDLTLQPKISERAKRVKKPPQTYLTARDMHSECTRFVVHHAPSKRY